MEIFRNSFLSLTFLKYSYRSSALESGAFLSFFSSIFRPSVFSFLSTLGQKSECSVFIWNAHTFLKIQILQSLQHN